jgi:hypothetical protein
MHTFSNKARALCDNRDTSESITALYAIFINGALSKTKIEPDCPTDGDDTVPLATLRFPTQKRIDMTYRFPYHILIIFVGF